MIVIIDYGMGNIKSVQHALAYLGYQVKLSDEPEEITKADGVILPGVGAFPDAIRVLVNKKLDKAIKAFTAQGKPFLGICLGMQLLFSYSDEHGYSKGLDLIPGKVVRFSAPLKVPHLGWNQIVYPERNTKHFILFQGVKTRSYFYFLHSYYCVPEYKEEEIAFSYYGHYFTSAVRKDNIWGVQFHQEKSSKQGLQVLKKFGEITNDNYSSH